MKQKQKRIKTSTPKTKNAGTILSFERLWKHLKQFLETFSLDY